MEDLRPRRARHTPHYGICFAAGASPMLGTISEPLRQPGTIASTSQVSHRAARGLLLQTLAVSMSFSMALKAKALPTTSSTCQADLGMIWSQAIIALPGLGGVLPCLMRAAEYALPSICAAFKNLS